MRGVSTGLRSNDLISSIKWPEIVSSYSCLSIDSNFLLSLPSFLRFINYFGFVVYNSIHRD